MKNSNLEIAQRLSALLVENHKNASELSRAVGVSPQAVKQWLDGDTSPRGKNLETAAAFFGVTPAYLKFGDSPIRAVAQQAEIREHSSSDQDSANTIQGSNISQTDFNIHQENRVPIISWVQAGLWVESNVMDETWEMNAWAHTSVKVSESVFALVVEGDSMTCDLGGYTFPHGTILICDPEQECRVGSFVIAKDTSTQQTTFKRLDGDGFSHRLTALNKKYEPIPIDNGHIRIIAKVVEKVLSEKLP